MTIPESDHQTVANLIAFASLLIAAIAVIYALQASRKAKQIAVQANRMANEANDLAQEALQILTLNHKVKHLPEVSMKFQVSKISRISAGSDNITLIFTNESQSTVVLDRVYISPPFKGQMDTSSTLNYREEKKIRIYIDELSPSLLSNHPRSGSDDIETLRQMVEETLLKSIISLQVMNEMNNHYDIDLKYNLSSDQFEGTPIPLSYRSKNDADKKLA